MDEVSPLLCSSSRFSKYPEFYSQYNTSPCFWLNKDVSLVIPITKTPPIWRAFVGAANSDDDLLVNQSAIRGYATPRMTYNSNNFKHLSLDSYRRSWRLQAPRDTGLRYAPKFRAAKTMQLHSRLLCPCDLSLVLTVRTNQLRLVIQLVQTSDLLEGSCSIQLSYRDLVRKWVGPFNFLRRSWTPVQFDPYDSLTKLLVSATPISRMIASGRAIISIIPNCIRQLRLLWSHALPLCVNPKYGGISSQLFWLSFEHNLLAINIKAWRASIDTWTL